MSDNSQLPPPRPIRRNHYRSDAPPAPPMPSSSAPMPAPPRQAKPEVVYVERRERVYERSAPKPVTIMGAPPWALVALTILYWMIGLMLVALYASANPGQPGKVMVVFMVALIVPPLLVALHIFAYNVYWILQVVGAITTLLTLLLILVGLVASPFTNVVF